MTPVLEIRNLTRRFPRTDAPAVDRLDLSMEDRSITALTGESGCGKSTTLRMIAGFEIADAGDIRLMGRPVDGDTPGSWVPPEKRRVGMVFQDHALFPQLSVERNIGFGLEKAGRTTDGKRRIEELLDLTGLAGLEKRYPHELSGGQQQRVAVARALAPRPDLLLMDEAFNNLDVRLKQRLLPEARQMLKDSGIPTLVVTHDRYEAFELADRIVVMREGRIVQDGSPREIYENPRESYIADFFGETNFVDLKEGRFAVRPENIWITAETTENGGGEDRSLDVRGRICDLRYRGQFHELYVRVDDAVSTMNGKILLAHAHGMSSYGPEQVVRVHVPSRALIPLAPD